MRMLALVAALAAGTVAAEGQSAPGPAGSGAPAADPPPNVVLIMADDLGWGDTGFNGSATALTPNLDAMARAGVRMSRFYAASPVCSPTRGSVMTGRHPHRYGIWSANIGHLPQSEVTLPELLRERGYETGFFGKWHLGTLTREGADANRGGPEGAQHFSPPALHGFRSVFATESKVPTYDPMLRPRGIERDTWWDAVADSAHAVPYGTAYWDAQGRRVTEGLRGDDSRVIVDRAVSFIRRSAAEGRPFLAVVWLHAPHLPVVADSAHRAPFLHLDRYAQHYFGSILALDEQVGRLRQLLREVGVADETVVWFSSDNGPEGQEGSAPGSAGELRGRKRDLWEGGIRVPALVEWPRGIRAGSTLAEPVVSTDLFPTVLDIVGIPIPARRPLDGESVLPLLRGEAEARRRPIGFAFQGQMALIGSRYKLIHRPPTPLPPGPGPATTTQLQYQLYDIELDPGERQDLAETQPETLRAMRAELESWWHSLRSSQ